MLELEWGNIAQDDVIAIVVYIAVDNPVAAMALKDEIEHKEGVTRSAPHVQAWACKGNS